MLWQAHTFISKNGFGWTVPPGAQPAVDFFRKNKLPGPIFNNFDIGSFLDYRLYPKEKVFVDGRPEAYPANFFQQVYIPLQTDPKIFEKVDKKYNFTTIFFAHTDQTPWATTFLQQISKNPSWHLIYLDETIVVFVKDTEKNKHLIKQFGMDQNHVTLSHVDPQNGIELAHLANVFIAFGWTQQEEKINQLLIQHPRFACFALSRLAIISANPSLYQTRLQMQCPTY